VPQALFAHIRFPVEENLARKISLLPELVRDCPKMSVLVSLKYPVTRIFQEGSVLVEEPPSAEMPQVLRAKGSGGK